MEDAIHKEKINLVHSIIKLALAEDLEPNGDISAPCLTSKTAKAQIIAKEPGVMACSWLVEAVLRQYDPNTTFNIISNCQDSLSFEAGQILFTIEANSRNIVATERTILNFLQRLCGIATYTNKLVKLIQDYPVKLLDTRKTMPGMRVLEKAAFKYGGGTNHRFNLSDMVMLKENHLACIEDLSEVISKFKNEAMKIEVEINKDNLAKLELAIQAGVDQIMLDNFSPAEIKELKNKIALLPMPQPKLEASGGINESNLVDYAKTGVDYISTSISFTKANNIDLSLIITD
ncbi:MAG: carboxylating nicotinate-nucleotide diphosphorylase [Cyanobacteria bacterium]|nr:carboxylating nicotinate-nucleotide diphosphorylase [Cyanobacteriota bacterium]